MSEKEHIKLTIPGIIDVLYIENSNNNRMVGEEIQVPDGNGKWKTSKIISICYFYNDNRAEIFYQSGEIELLKNIERVIKI